MNNNKSGFAVLVSIPAFSQLSSWEGVLMLSLMNIISGLLTDLISGMLSVPW